MTGTDRRSEAELRAFVGLGSNLGDRLATLRSAARALATDAEDTRVVAAPSVYETRPLGPSKGAFLNAVVELRTGLQPEELLAWLLELESRHGRERRRRWDARTLDLDLLLAMRRQDGRWAQVHRDDERLRVPHPQMSRRDFVLQPLAELVGDEAVLDGQTPRQWLARIGAQERTILRRLEDGLLEAEGE